MHYIRDKISLLRKIDRWTVPGGCNAISLWSNFTTVPDCHQVVPTYPDQEGGVVVSHYAAWVKVLKYFEREKSEESHSDLGTHVHSFIKLITLKSS